MRVVIINDFSVPSGGASILACQLAAGLESRGIPVTFFSGDKPGSTQPCRDTICVGGEPLIRQSKAGAFVGGLYNRRAYGMLRDWIAANDSPDTVYHVHGISQTLSPSVLRALTPLRARTVLHAHDFFLPCPNGGFADYRTSTVCERAPLSVSCLTTQCDKRNALQKAWRVTRQTIREHFFPIRGAAATILLIHDCMAPYFARAGIRQERLRAIRNPVEPILQTPPAPWRNRDFLFIGRIEHEKGYDIAAEAAYRAGVRLHFIGDGVGRPTLAERYPETVVHGWKTRDEMCPLLATARAVVVASRVPEPFGLAAIEAAASGIPVIVPQAALLGPELVRIGCGITFATADASDLAQQMAGLAQDDVIIRSMSESGRAHAMDLSNTLQSWIDAIVATYRELLAEQTAVAPIQGNAAPTAQSSWRSGLRGVTTSYSVGSSPEGQLKRTDSGVSFKRGI